MSPTQPNQPKPTLQDVVKGTPAGQKAVETALERSVEVMDKVRQASADSLDDIDYILANFAGETKFPEVIKQYAGYKEARAAILAKKGKS